jgi:hypothetical protein
MIIDPGPAAGAAAPGSAPPRRRLAGLRDLARRILPYLVGAVMFAVAVWVLHSTLGRFDLDDLRAELAELTGLRLGLAVMFTALSFVCLVGYE